MDQRDKYMHLFVSTVLPLSMLNNHLTHSAYL